MHQTVARNVVQQQGCGNVGAISELSSPPFGADNHFLKKYSIENQYYIFRIGQTSAFTWYILDTSENQWEISEVGRLSCFIEFLHEFTLFVIDIHHNMLISLFPTPFHHFHFHGSAGLFSRLLLTPCSIYTSDSLYYSIDPLKYEFHKIE